MLRPRPLARKATVTAIEVGGQSAEYEWARIDKVVSFQWRTLFPDAASQHVSVGQLTSKLCAALEQIKPDVVAIPGSAERSALIALTWCLEMETPVVLMSKSTAIDAKRYWLKEEVKNAFSRW